ncbi:MAG: hypothetical protein ACRBCI_14315 [Cellvibrionaceae bacterium]
MFVSACSAQDAAPTDQLIEGPFNITTEWQTIPLEKPLKTLPHVQTLEVLLDVEQYEFIETTEVGSENSIMSGRFKRLQDNMITHPDIILVTDTGSEFQPVHRSIGLAYTKKGDLRSLGFGTNPDKGKFYYPHDVKFVALKVKSNVSMTINHFRWIARHYYQAPNDKWEDVDKSKIVNLK